MGEYCRNKYRTHHSRAARLNKVGLLVAVLVNDNVTVYVRDEFYEKCDGGTGAE